MNASAPSPSPNPSPADPEAARQKGAARAPRIPVKVIPAGEPLREPDWIRVRPATDPMRFARLKAIVRGHGVSLHWRSASD